MSDREQEAGQRSNTGDREEAAQYRKSTRAGAAGRRRERGEEESARLRGREEEAGICVRERGEEETARLRGREEEAGIRDRERGEEETARRQRREEEAGIRRRERRKEKSARRRGREEAGIRGRERGEEETVRRRGREEEAGIRGREREEAETARRRGREEEAGIRSRERGEEETARRRGREEEAGICGREREEAETAHRRERKEEETVRRRIRNGNPRSLRRRAEENRMPRRAREEYEGSRRRDRREKEPAGIGTILFVSFQVVIVAALIFCAVIFYRKFGVRIIELYQEAEKKVEASDESVFYSSQTTLVYDDEGTVINTLKGDKDVYYLKYEEIPDYVKQAFVSIEDKRFYKHKGFDMKAIFRAVVSLVRKQSITQGGSTITQQLSRNIFLSHTVRWERKVEEIFIAMHLEKKYSKEQILEYYINNIYYSNGYYGIEAASRGYFGKSVSELSLSQTAFLCAIPNSPGRYDPRTGLENTLTRRNRILEEMLEDGVIDQAAYDEARAETITLAEQQTVEVSNYMQSYATNCAVKELMRKQNFEFRYKFSSDADRAAYDEEYGEVYQECQNLLVTGGYRVYTSLDQEKQEVLQRAVDETLVDFVNHSTDGVYAMQGAAACIDNDSGMVVAIVGGRSQDDVDTSLNRAYQSSRQPGSTMKPLVVYAPALEGTYTADTVINDHKFAGGPENAGGVYYGNVTLRRAVEKSLNTVAWQVLEDIGVDTGLKKLYDMQFAKIMDADRQLSTALGGLTKGATTVEMASGYAALANEGKFRNPTCVLKITDAFGEVIVDNTDMEEKQVYTSEAAHRMTNILEGVMKSGTGKALVLENMPSAGKTGTTNDNKDGWFVGYTPYYTTAVWVGCDQVRALNGLSGSSYPGTIWKQYMQTVHDGLPEKELND